MSRKISLSYVNNLSDIDKAEFNQSYLQSRGVLLKLRKILKEKQRVSESHKLKLENYALPSWSEMQADSNGYQRALNEVINYLLPDPVGEEND